jgi:hypothetical protein
MYIPDHISEIRDGKTRIRDKHPGSETLQIRQGYGDKKEKKSLIVAGITEGGRSKNWFWHACPPATDGKHGTWGGAIKIQELTNAHQ